MTEANGESADVQKDVANTTAVVDDTKIADQNGGGKNVLDDAGEGEGKAPEAVVGWREKLSGGDEKFLEQLKRFGSEKDFGKAYREMEKMKGQVKKNLAENPTPEQLTEWRKDNGIPETADKYELKLPDGIQVSAEDKPMVDEFLKSAHTNNMSPQAVNAAVGWYMQAQEMQKVQAKEKENVDRQQAIQELRNELGAEYKPTQGMIQAWLGRQGEVGEMLLSARDGSGKALFNSSQFVMWLNNYIRQTEPSATVVHDTEMMGSSVDDEIEKIRKVIKEQPDKYNKDQKMQQRMQQLSSAKQKVRA